MLAKLRPATETSAGDGALIKDAKIEDAKIEAIRAETNVSRVAEYLLRGWLSGRYELQRKEKN